MVRKEFKIKVKQVGDNAGDPPAQEVFRRTEVKYVLTPQQTQALLGEIKEYIQPDKYPKGTNCSIYFDNDSKYLALHSLEKPIYKEKIRVRSYNTPKSLDDTVFVEIKKKFDGIGHKRRVAVRLKDFYDYLETGSLNTPNAQIRRELDYCFQKYDLHPFLFLAYDRHSYTGTGEDQNFRLTFDQNIRYRLDDLRLEHGSQGQNYFQNGEIVMEAKALDSYPMWFAHALSKLKIYPASFSKYGKVCLYLNERSLYV
ncbi:polyphosphate polymerase domain-containing protein [Candidatus Saccharibacteria bacterium]|nr:polyphosphate polymerase domain-containing protein [Candidatus Saccharibacteria bacterium]